MAIPGYWDYNVVRVEGPDAGLDAAELMRAADSLQDGLAHRRIEIEDPVAAGRVTRDFLRAGWQAERLAWMRREAPPLAAPAGIDVEEVGFAVTRPLRLEWASGDSTWTNDAAAVQRIVELEAMVAAARASRAFAVRARSGVVGFTSLWAPADADAAEIEQLYVTPPQRDHGYGAALVAAAIAAAQREVIWIVAAADGRAKRLYTRLGFETVWLQHAFTRRPPA